MTRVEHNAKQREAAKKRARRAGRMFGRMMTHREIAAALGVSVSAVAHYHLAQPDAWQWGYSRGLGEWERGIYRRSEAL